MFLNVLRQKSTTRTWVSDSSSNLTSIVSRLISRRLVNFRSRANIKYLKIYQLCIESNLYINISFTIISLFYFTSLLGVSLSHTKIILQVVLPSIPLSCYVIGKRASWFAKKYDYFTKCRTSLQSNNRRSR